MLFWPISILFISSSSILGVLYRLRGSAGTCLAWDDENWNNNFQSIIRERGPPSEGEWKNTHPESGRSEVPKTGIQFEEQSNKLKWTVLSAVCPVVDIYSHSRFAEEPVPPKTWMRPLPLQGLPPGGAVARGVRWSMLSWSGSKGKLVNILTVATCVTPPAVFNIKEEDPGFMT